MNEKACVVRVVGYLPKRGINESHYRDFANSEFTELEVETGLKQGIYPPGLVIKTRWGEFMVAGQGVYSEKKRVSYSQYLDFCGGYKVMGNCTRKGNDNG